MIKFDELYLNFFDGNKIVVDCGHLPLHYDNHGFGWGPHGKGPSETQKTTLVQGLFLFNKLMEIGKNPILSICITDTTKYISSKEARDQIKAEIEDRSIIKRFDSTYLELLNRYQVAEAQIAVTLQSQNSNKFSNLLKKSKKIIKNQNNLSDTYDEFNAMFLKSKDGETFGFTSPYLLDSCEEVESLNGDWWLDDFYTLNDYDTSIAPMARLKKLKVINLYNQSKGILCPATYCGLMLHFGNDFNHIAVYSRKDDEYISEKISRGIITNYLLNPLFSKKCLTITTSDENIDPEILYLDRSKVTIKENYEDFVNSFNNTKLSEYYLPYTQ